ncbi:unnamed protein product [Durusdinium trenchii]
MRALEILLSKARGATFASSALNFKKSFLTDDDMELLCSSPKFCITMSKVEDFCINVNDISDIGLSRWAHVGALLPFSSLTDFFAIDNLFGDEFMKVFAEAAGKGAFPSLRLMYLYGNAIGDDGFEALTEAMAQDAFAPKGLETLLVMGNKITDKGAVSLWKPMQLGRLRLLRSFGIGNGVSDEGLQMLVEGGLQGNLPELSELHLTENPLTDKGIASLLQAREAGALECLSHVGLEGTRTSARARRAVLDMLERREDEDG